VNVGEAIEARRALRSFAPAEIGEETVRDLARYAGLAASCWNRQPWRLVFVRDAAQRSRISAVLAPHHEWADAASMMVAVFSRPEDDCVEKERAYNLFDSGIATGFLLLRASELGLSTHPISGFDEGALKRILEIPDGYQVSTLILVGGRAERPDPRLSARQAAEESKRPTRFPFEKYAFLERYAPQKPAGP